MSDGPHRSLPMRPHWRRFAERAATPAYARNEVLEALPVALTKDFLGEAPLSEVAAILRGARQRPLFREPLFREPFAEQLEAVRDAHAGSVAACALIDCAIEEAANGRGGDDVLRTVIERALQAHARSGCRQIEEHYHRAGRNSVDFRNRLRDARAQTPYSEIASDLISRRPSARDLRLPKRSDVDEGPPL